MSYRVFIDRQDLRPDGVTLLRLRMEDLDVDGNIKSWAFHRRVIEPFDNFSIVLDEIEEALLEQSGLPGIENRATFETDRAALDLSSESAERLDYINYLNRRRAELIPDKEVPPPTGSRFIARLALWRR